MRVKCFLTDLSMAQGSVCLALFRIGEFIMVLEVLLTIINQVFSLFLLEMMASN